MNLSITKNKFILTIILAVIFQLTNFILTQWLIELDDNLKSKKYEIISNEMKLKDIDSNIFDTIPDLIKMSKTYELNSNLYLDYYNDVNEYENNFYPILQHLKFYLVYIKEDFFLDSKNDYSNKLYNFEKDFNYIKNKKTHIKLNFLTEKLFNVSDSLLYMREAIYNKNMKLMLQKLNYESSRYLINIGLVVTQILNLLCLSFFFFFFLSDKSEIKNMKT
jgi:hypothetical protein